MCQLNESIGYTIKKEGAGYFRDLDGNKLNVFCFTR